MSQIAEAAAAAAADAPPRRPTVVIPPRASFESLLRWAATPGRGGVSPGPLTFVSSLFADDPGSACPSFSELLAGAMASPPAKALPVTEAAEAAMGFSSLPSSVEVERRYGGFPLFMIPAGISPAGLLDSPGFLSPGPFGMSHQQVLAQVTAQAAQYQSHLPVSPLSVSQLEETPPQTSEINNSPLHSTEGSPPSERKPNILAVVCKPADDGYNWRKYGQKNVKRSGYPRSYFKCTHPSCLVKKKVEYSLDGLVTEIIYKGQHNHEHALRSRRNKDGVLVPKGPNESKFFFDIPAVTENSSQTLVSGLSETISVPLLNMEGESEKVDQLAARSEEEEIVEAEVWKDEGDEGEPESKRRNVVSKTAELALSHRTVTEPRITLQTISEVDLLDDGYRWRKYGQKVVKANPNPRSYYKCTFVGCKVRKHVERSSTDPKTVITTYEGKHEHDIPIGKNTTRTLPV